MNEGDSAVAIVFVRQLFCQFAPTNPKTMPFENGRVSFSKAYLSHP
jgi:hypothetical protein